MCMKDTVSRRVRWYIPFKATSKLPESEEDCVQHTQSSSVPPQLLTATQPLSLDYTHRRSAWRLLKLVDVIRMYICDIPCAAEQVWRLTIARMISSVYKMPLCVNSRVREHTGRSYETYIFRYAMFENERERTYIYHPIYNLWPHCICINLIHICIYCASRDFVVSV